MPDFTPLAVRRSRLPWLLVMLLVLTITGTTHSPGYGQQEIVPAEDPVYEFLHLQRVAGHLSGYRHETRPLERGRILQLLDSLHVHRHELTASAQYWAEHYRQQFGEPPEHIETVIHDGTVSIPRRTNTVKYLYYVNRNDWRFAARGGIALESRYGRDSLQYRGESIAARLRMEGNYREAIGFYTDTFNGYQFTGDGRALKKDPILRPLYYVSRSPTPMGNFDRTTASLRIGSNQVAAELANERLLIGPGYTTPLIMGNAADYFPFVRLTVRTGIFQYQYIHGSLNDRNRIVLSDEHPDRGVYLGTERSLALHRASLHPTSSLSLGFTEWVIYGQRGVELAYLNPLYPFTTAEHALWDRDNVLFALDGVYRPIEGLETFGAIVVDDLDFSEIGQHSYHTKLGYQTGAGYTPVSSVLTWLTYTRVDPFVYTHRFELEGSFYNSYHHNGYTLGHPIGPNADRLEVGFRYWFPRRISSSLRIQYARRGENYIGAGGELTNVGGDPVNGVHPSYSERSKRFLAGGRFSGPGLTAELTWEPVRDFIQFQVAAYWQQWDYKGIRPLYGKESPPDEALTRVQSSGDDEVFVRFSARFGL